MGHRDQPPRTKCATFPRGLPSSPSPIPTRPPGFALSLRDQADINSGSQPLTSGRGGFGFSVKDVTRRAYFDHLELFRQV
jgi:hypothetical protein